MINRLQTRKKTYYIRVSIPRDIVSLVQKKEICYSLKTNNYNEALIRLRRESAKIDMLIDRLREINMEIKNNIITLTEDEIRDLMIFQLRRIDDFCEDNEFQIRNRNGIWKGIDLETDSIKLFSKEADKDNPENKIVGIHKPQYIQQQLQELFYQYLEWKYNRNDTPLSLKTQIREIWENEPTFLEKENRNHYPADLLHLYRKFKEVDAYAENRLNAIKGEPNIEPTTLQIQRLEALMNQEKEEDIKKGLQIKHSWKEICAKMLQLAKHSREIKKDTIDQKEKCLETIFELIDKEYIEQISDSDCEKVNELIYRVPKRWKIT